MWPSLIVDRGLYRSSRIDSFTPVLMNITLFHNHRNKFSMKLPLAVSHSQTESYVPAFCRCLLTCLSLSATGRCVWRLPSPDAGFDRGCTLNNAVSVIHDDQRTWWCSGVSVVICCHYPGYGHRHNGTWNKEQFNFGNPSLDVIVLRAQVDQIVVEIIILINLWHVACCCGWVLYFPLSFIGLAVLDLCFL